ncbi:MULTISPECIES: GTP pyrophosphokinase family protein [Chryseobacterium]|uniref:(P)ppGpp synthetase n=1 Tax=Chryseobacterium endophyticum TaxID=1854762 RepID=A0AAU6WRY7_9FLAO|nr:(p)ppGpp synthetase [uncultured Chryseobacterium sp.]
MAEEYLNKILAEYRECYSLYSALGSKVEQLLRRSCRKIPIHQITGRVKTKASLAQKIIKKDKYKSLNEITDILGLRVITYFEDDISKIEEVLNREFTVDWSNSVDKGHIEIDKFGYKSIHFILQVNDQKAKSKEYADYKEIRFEIQLRSILQHSWAEIEHDLGYKSVTDIPEKAQRTFYRVAALLEQADIEFTKLKKEIHEFENSVSKNLKNKRELININESTIIAFVKKNPLLREIEGKVRKALRTPGQSRFDTAYISANHFPAQLKDLGILNLIQLEDQLLQHKDEIITSEISYLKSVNKNLTDRSIKFAIPQGAPILWLIHYFQSKHNTR